MMSSSSRRPVQITDLTLYKLVSDPQFSPDGDAVLFGLKTTGAKNKSISHLHRLNGDGQIVQLTQGDKSASMGRWAPHGGSIAFVSARGGTSQIWHLPPFGEAEVLTTLDEGTISDIKWSPDGSKIAFTYRPTQPEFTSEGVKTRTEQGLSEAPKVINSVWYRLDGDGYFNDQRFSVWILDVATKTANSIYSACPSGDYSFAWTPDSKELVVIHTANARPFAEKPNDQVYRVKLDGSATMIPGLPKGEKSNPKVSPDGNWIAYSGDVDENDPWGTRNTKLYLTDFEGKTYKDLTGHQDHDYSVATLSDTKEAAYGSNYAWLPDGSALIAQVGTRGETQLVSVALDGTESKLITFGQHGINLGNLSPDGKFAIGVYGDPLTIPELVKVDLSTGNLERKSNFNQAYLDEVALSAPEEIELTSQDGTKVHGWVIKPIGFDPAKQYPAVLEIHGGPHTQYGWAFFHEFQVLAAQGYFVVYTNPRGSKGYGEAFCNAIQGDWGHKDWEDIQAAQAYMESHPNMDAKKLGIMGGSYGGYMTNWAIGHTKSFRAAISDRCVSNMVSMAGNSDFPFNKDGYFKGVAWGSLEDIKELWRQSPIAYFQDVVTPTLLIHSEGDLRCNVEQSEQVFTALQQQGVESRFVRYPSSTSHGMSRGGPADLRMHRLGEIVAWWKKHLG